MNHVSNKLKFGLEFKIKINKINMISVAYKKFKNIKNNAYMRQNLQKTNSNLFSQAKFIL